MARNHRIHYIRTTPAPSWMRDFTMFNLVALLLVLTAIFAYFNYRYTKLPTTIGVMAGALILSMLVIGLDWLGFPAFKAYEESALRSLDFTATLMQGMLSFLLFAGALHVDLNKLKNQFWQIGGLAIIGTIASTLLVGFAVWYLLPFAGIQLPLIYCLLFGALISPTDPIAVLGILKSVNVPKKLETTIVGESLFNDGVGVVLFILLLDIAVQGGQPSVGDTLTLFGREAVGGALFGLLLGSVVNRMLKDIDNYQIEILITLATVMGGYALANALHISGPIAMVVVGLLIGNHGREFSMSARTRGHLDIFWELIDEILNAVLFVFLGLEIVLIAFPDHSVAASLIVIAITLSARALTVGVPVLALPRWFDLPAGSAPLLTWGGVRGGISVALALSIPVSPSSEIIVMLTYSVVLFSVFVQGLTIGAVAKRVCEK